LNFPESEEHQLSRAASDKLFKYIISLGSSLITLDVHSNPFCDKIMQFDFPQLRSLRLAGWSQKDTSHAMSFWERHPLIGRLDLGTQFEHEDSRVNGWLSADIPSHFDHGDIRANAWFSAHIPPHFLPNLRHLRVTIFQYH